MAAVSERGLYDIIEQHAEQYGSVSKVCRLEDAILTSDWLAERDRRVRAEVLREVATHFETKSAEWIKPPGDLWDKGYSDARHADIDFLRSLAKRIEAAQ